MAKKKHKDVEFIVEGPGPTGAASTPRGFYDTAEDARGEPVTIDVVVHSKAGARWYGGDWAVEEYEEDPDASVFEHIVVRAESQGRIP